MLNFTVGPVMSSQKVREIGAEQIPYFRTEEFSSVMLENERLIKKFARAGDDARVVFITGSGTASMEAAIMNTLTTDDRAIVVNGGSFGQRFVQLCKIHNIALDEIKLDPGKALTAEALQAFEGKDYSAFIVNAHETSTGVLYDMSMISRFCKRNHLFLIVDAISSFLADDFDMKELGVDVMITGSQKALACPPGISIIVLSPAAIDRVNSNAPQSMYFDLRAALENGKRGQTPFTPAVGTLLQIHARLRDIEEEGGEGAEKKRIAAVAEDFRDRIGDLPLDIYSEAMSNAVTPLATRGCSANDIFLILKKEYGIWICPNGGELKDKMFRVGHIGSLSIEDNTKLIDALHDLVKRGILK